jgi:hypothetical protein
MLSVCAKCHYAECRALFIVTLNVIVSSAIMPSVFVQSVIMLSVVAPLKRDLTREV